MMDQPLAPSAEYRGMVDEPRDAGVQFGWPALAACAAMGIAFGAILDGSLHAFLHPVAQADEVQPHFERFVDARWLSKHMPAPCDGWEARCKKGAIAADEQGHGKYWVEDLCDEKIKGRLVI